MAELSTGIRETARGRYAKAARASTAGSGLAVMATAARQPGNIVPGPLTDDIPAPLAGLPPVVAAWPSCHAAIRPRVPTAVPGGPEPAGDLEG